MGKYKVIDGGRWYAPSRLTDLTRFPRRVATPAHEDLLEDAASVVVYSEEPGRLVFGHSFDPFRLGQHFDFGRQYRPSKSLLSRIFERTD